ncbi:metal ABC transporter solute-binding protein, Zn/Mn family [Dethiosulfatarculus sandiegensis]|uniref:ABC transporter substrate-binding protein n=1 Tax=Dethiosulfatarculus sandiegensis TaxID=1429043 RepID=A0A0D2JPK8_9BACT|nr:zinc ABC transporter substrate-binding protein [Dethiosulfatarculus sandiegensis]KIX11415.1 ABC transporter substrate-binding protein [Dethiosulfatarculus sandiegensis]
MTALFAKRLLPGQKVFKTGFVFSLLIVSALLMSLVRPDSALAGDRLKVFVSITPQKYFVERIAGDLAQVEVMVPKAASPATYEPKPAQMAALQKARAYFAIGVPFEKTWLPRITAANPGMRIVFTQAKVPRVDVTTRKPVKGHESGPDSAHGGHKHTAGADPHIWLSPPLVAIQAQAILRELKYLDPANKGVYESNYQAFKKQIASLDEELRQAFSRVSGKNRLMVFHPAWGYFADAYGLKQIPVEKEGKEPTPRGLMALIKQARELEVKVIFVQPQFSTKAASSVAQAIGGKVLKIDPLALDWAANLKKAALEMKKALR